MKHIIRIIFISIVVIIGLGLWGLFETHPEILEFLKEFFENLVSKQQ